jgi:hypothetical protein
MRRAVVVFSVLLLAAPPLARAGDYDDPVHTTAYEAGLTFDYGGMLQANKAGAGQFGMLGLQIVERQGKIGTIAVAAAVIVGALYVGMKEAQPAAALAIAPATSMLAFASWGQATSELTLYPGAKAKGADARWGLLIGDMVGAKLGFSFSSFSANVTGASDLSYKLAEFSFGIPVGLYLRTSKVSADLDFDMNVMALGGDKINMVKRDLEFHNSRLRAMLGFNPNDFSFARIGLNVSDPKFKSLGLHVEVGGRLF